MEGPSMEGRFGSVPPAGAPGRARGRIPATRN